MYTEKEHQEFQFSARCVLHVVAEMDPKMGGVSQALHSIIAGLTKLGLRNEVVSLDHPDALFLKETGFKIHNPGKGEGAWCYCAAFMPWLLKNLDRYEVVIVHGLWRYHSHATGKAIQVLKDKNGNRQGKGRLIPKLFIMPHGMLDPYFQRAKGRRLKAIRNKYYWKFIERNVVNKADGLLFTSQEELILARETFRPYQPKREIIVGLGLEAPEIYTAAMKQAFLKKCPQLNGSPYFLFLGRIHEKKGVDMLIGAYTENIMSISSLGIPGMQSPKLVIAGPGMETPYGKQIKLMVSNSPEVRDMIFFPGMITGDAKWGAFYGCQAFILPSHQENFGIAVVEALACRKPVLISNQVNIWREINTSGAGFVAPDTLEGTISLFQQWYNSRREDIQRMQFGAGHSYEKYFSMTETACRLRDAMIPNA
jgi:glycosyltransferase involved in cell wall biosynthesis